MMHRLFIALLIPFFSQAQDTSYVNQGDIKASSFLQRQCETIGLQPMEEHFFQEFSFDVNTFPGAMSVKINELPLVTGKDFIIKPSSLGIEGQFDVFRFKPSMAK